MFLIQYKWRSFFLGLRHLHGSGHSPHCAEKCAWAGLGSKQALFAPSHCRHRNVHMRMQLSFLLLGVGAAAASRAASLLKSSYPVPSALPPHSWDSVGQKVFIHGCKASGLFNATELATAAKFSLMTVEKGQGLALPGFADDKMAAIAEQWKAARRALKLAEGWALFYINAHFDWPFFAIHTQVWAGCTCKIDCCMCQACVPLFVLASTKNEESFFLVFKTPSLNRTQPGHCSVH